MVMLLVDTVLGKEVGNKGGWITFFPFGYSTDLLSDLENTMINIKTLRSTQSGVTSIRLGLSL